MDFNIYVIYNRPFKIINSPIFTQISPVASMNMLTSNTGDNLSNENNFLAEYSTFYWVWKNDLESKYVGFFHFRRLLSFNDDATAVTTDENLPLLCNWNYNTAINLMNDYDILLPPATNFFSTTVKQQYYNCHNSYYLDKSLEIISLKYPHLMPSFTRALNYTWGYYCNMFIMKRHLFNEYMDFIFDIFTELKKDHNPLYEFKIYAYLGERLFSCYVEFLKSERNIKFKELPQVFVHEDYSCVINKTLI